MSHPVRKPRFLSGVPEAPKPQPARFGAAVPRPLHDDAGAALPPQPPPPDLTELRRDVMDRLSAAVATLRAQADHVAEQARADAIEIGFQVARKVIGAELHQSPDALFALVRAAVQRAGESRRITVRVSPEDAPLLQSEAGRAALDGLSAARIEFVTEPSLQHGDCLVDADFGQVDGRLTTRLAEIRRAVDAAAMEEVG